MLTTPARAGPARSSGAPSMVVLLPFVLVSFAANSLITAAGTAQLAIPVLTTAGAVLLLGERLSPTLLVAAVLVGGGMWLGRPTSPKDGRS